MRIFSEASYQFIEKRRMAYVVSAAAIGAGILAMILNVFSLGSWLNYGVDFTGGTLIQVRFHEPTTAGELRTALGGATAPTLTRFGQENEFVIRAPLEEGASVDEVSEAITSRIEAAYGPGVFEVVRTELVGPKIGAELQEKAALAILFSFVLTLIYVAIRFELRFGLAAIVATFHDILIALGFLAAFRLEISLPTVAAILTIVGYSLNDTIVVFDRIRENLNKKGGRKEDPVKLVDRSINETLPRTVLTSGTTLLVLVSLLVLGGAVIRDFTLILILGILIGTYSSIFVAAPVLLEIQQRWGVGKVREKGEKPRRREPATV